MKPGDIRISSAFRRRPLERSLAGALIVPKRQAGRLSETFQSPRTSSHSVPFQQSPACGHASEHCDSAKRRRSATNSYQFARLWLKLTDVSSLKAVDPHTSSAGYEMLSPRLSRLTADLRNR